MTMRKNIKKWVEALESGKYRQTTGALRKIKNKKSYYCCLGVACKLYQDEVGDLEVGVNENGAKTYDGQPDFLPTKVQKWLGLKDVHGIYKKKKGITTSLVDANDVFGKNFKEIAAIIRKEYKNLVDTSKKSKKKE